MISSDLVSKFIAPHNSSGEGALVFRKQESTAILLAAALEFTFKSQRRPAGVSVAPAPTELIVTGHFVGLVERKGRKCPRWAFDEKRAAYSEVGKHGYKIALAHEATEAAGVSEPLMSFLSVLKS